MRVYLAGPMSDHINYNKPAFFRAAGELRCKGYFVLNPAETDNESKGVGWEDFLRKDMRMLMEADTIALLPGWESSRGARFELYVAMTLGLHVMDAETGREIYIRLARQPDFKLVPEVINVQNNP